jgi:hypothetical protein
LCLTWGVKLLTDKRVIALVGGVVDTAVVH